MSTKRAGALLDQDKDDGGASRPQPKQRRDRAAAPSLEDSAPESSFYVKPGQDEVLTVPCRQSAEGQ